MTGHQFSATKAGERTGRKVPLRSHRTAVIGDVGSGLVHGVPRSAVIDHGRFKGERLVKKALYSRPQRVNRCVSLPEAYPAIRVRADHRRDQPGASTDTPTGEAVM